VLILLSDEISQSLKNNHDMSQKSLLYFIATKSFKLFSKTVCVKEFEARDRMESAMGRSDSKNNQISICKELPSDVQEETLLHETIHLISENLGLELKEKQVQGLSVGLYDFLKSNGLIG
jgi:hypothetical protein